MALRPYDFDEVMYLAEEKAKQLTDRFNKIATRETVNRFVAKRRLPPRYITILTQIWDALEMVYPGRGDIQYVFKPKYKLVRNQYGNGDNEEFRVHKGYEISHASIIVYFPEVTITNSRKHSMLLKDLYTKITVTMPGGTRGTPSFGSLYGLRLTQTSTEAEHKYAHSHLSSKDYASNGLTWDYFCMGDCDLTATLSLLNSSFDVDLMALALQQIELYVTWESIEGGPYQHMSDIKDTTTNFLNKYNTNQVRTIWLTIADCIKRGRVNLEFDWALRNGRFEIVDNEKTDAMFTDLLQITGYTHSNYFVYKDVRGEYFVENTNFNSRHIGEHPDKFIYFRGRKHTFKISGQSRTRGDVTKYVNPKIKEYVKQRLEYKANYSQVRRNRIGQQDTSVNS